MSLTRLHPAATTGALECGAVAQTREWVDGHRGRLTDYDSVQRWVLSTAHYYGQKALLGFQVANQIGSVQPDSIVVGCKLTLNGVPAILNPKAGLNLPGQSGPMFVTSGAVAFLQARPIQWQPQ